MSNYKILFNLKVLKNILSTVVDSFLILYFFDVSRSNILPLGIYKLVAVSAIFVVMFFTRNFCKSKHRLYLMRIGIVLNFLYFLTIIILKNKVINYIYLVGVLYGLEEGFYYSVYNNIESDGVTNKERPRFNGMYTAVKSILSIIFPLVYGVLIYKTGFLNSLIVVLIMIFLQIFFSYFFKDNNISKTNKTDLKQYVKIIKENKVIMQVYKNKFFSGLTYS